MMHTYRVYYIDAEERQRTADVTMATPIHDLSVNAANGILANRVRQTVKHRQYHPKKVLRYEHLTVESVGKHLHRIVVEVQGGNIQAVYNIPECVEVAIHDYDTDGTDRSLGKDADGKLYALAVYGHDTDSKPKKRRENAR